MDHQELVRQYWGDIHRQQWKRLVRYFDEQAAIRWHNTDEQFTVSEFIRINKLYPGDWLIDIERLESAGDLVISVVRVYQKDSLVSVHTTSIFEFRGERIAALDEYWGNDEQAPKWRLDLHIGRSIIKE